MLALQFVLFFFFLLLFLVFVLKFFSLGYLRSIGLLRFGAGMLGGRLARLGSNWDAAR